MKSDPGERQSAVPIVLKLLQIIVFKAMGFLVVKLFDVEGLICHSNSNPLLLLFIASMQFPFFFVLFLLSKKIVGKQIELCSITLQSLM